MVLTEFIKAGILPEANELKSFGDEMVVFNAKLLNAAPVNAVAASHDFTAFKLTAKVAGVAGNAISLTLIEPDDDSDLIVALAENDPYGIVVTLEKDSTIQTNGTALVAALNADPLTKDLVVASAGTSALLSTTAKTALTLGVNGTFAPLPGVYFMDDDYVYVALARNEVSDANWKKLAFAS